MSDTIDEDLAGAAPLDAALRRAFRRPSAAAADAAAPSGAPEPETGFAGRYRLGPELGRGGMGIVRAAHDVLLGRDVALKLLRPELRASPERCRRFIEEARIASRLEHPGIVPVYDRGVTEEGEPFFTMKLVAGETLKARLAREGADPAARRRLLPLVQRVAEALAAAHEKGVVHRDLKPSNVMLGGLGEVLVTDFGLAKILDAPDGAVPAGAPSLSPIGTSETTLAGQVLGTPRYMAPEQAAGNTGAVGAPADVYALGAILHEVLTGATPAPAGTAADTAADEEALRGSGASDDILRLVRECLASDPGQRPATARAVAGALAAHEAGREEAVQTAERRAAIAAAKAAEERRSRRLTLALLLVLLVLAGGGATAWIAFDHDRSRRVRDAEVTAGKVLRTALAAQARAASAPPEDALGAWREALAAAEGAATAVRREETPSGLREEARTLVALAGGRVDAETAAAARRAADAALRGRLAEIRTRTLVRPDEEDLDRDYAEAFRTWGSDVLADDRDAVVAKLAASPLRRDIVDALHVWWHARSVLRREGPRDARWFLALARDVDDDPRSRELIDLRLSRGLDAVRDWMLREDLAPLVPLPLVQVAKAFHDAGRPDDALHFLRRIVAAHPDSVDAQAHLAMKACGWNGSADLAEYSRAISAAVALRPDLPALHHHLVMALYRSGSKEEASRRLADIRARDPAEPWFLHAEGIVAVIDGRLEDAARSLREVVRRDPGNLDAGNLCGQVLSRLGLWAEAEPVLRTYLARRPTTPSLRDLGLVLLARKCWLEAEACLREAVRLDPLDGAAQATLGRLLAQRFRYSGAAAAFRAALAARRSPGDKPARGDVERDLLRCEALAGRLTRDLEGFIGGGDVPGSPRLLLGLAGHARDREDPHAEVRVWQSGVQAFPDLLADWGAVAAEAALRVAGGSAEPKRLRDQARLWLEAELDAHAAVSDGEAKRRALTMVGWWTRSGAFSGIRDEAALSSLPEAEAASWRAFWKRVDDFLTTVRRDGS